MAIKSIRLTYLFVNTENYRFEPLTSQKEAIDKMIEDQGEKLYNLASDIMEFGLSPVDLIQVTLSGEENKYIVLEGNRRVTSLKLLNTPSLIGDNNIGLRKKFLKLQKDNSERLIKSIDCVLFENPSDADIWIKRKHSGSLEGIGTVTWNSQQKQRFEEKIEGKSSIPLQIISLMKSHEAVSENIKNNLVNLNTSNLQRLVADPYVRENLGIEINNGKLISKLESGEVIKGLMKVITDILDPKFKVADIYDRKKRKEYIDKFDKENRPDTTKEVEDQWELQSYNQANSNSTNTSTNNISQEKVKGKKNSSSERRTLIPSKVNIKIENPKINKIYEELKKIQVTSCPNASSILLRVFLELSIDTYIEKHNIIANNALTACASKESLQGKTGKVINHLRQRKLLSDDLSKGIRTEINDPNSVLSIESLNAYVHNAFFYPKADNLIIGWDNIERFIVILWNDINTETV